MYQQLTTLALLLLTITAVVDRYYRRYQNQRKAKDLGCLPVPLEPTKYPFGLDVFLALLKASKEERTPDFIVERYNAMGPRYTWRTRILGSEFYTTADPMNIQAMLSTQFNDFIMGEARRSNFKTVLGKSIFAAEGQTWHNAREVVRPIFSRSQVSDLSLLEHHVQQMFCCIAANDDGWTEEVSLTALMPLLTLDSATELFLGRSSGTLVAWLRTKSERPIQLPKDFLWAFERIQRLLSVRLRLRGLYWLYGDRELKECMKILHQFCDMSIQHAQRQPMMEKNGRIRYDFLNALLDRCPDNPSEVRDHVLGLLAAGRDTTASLISWAFYCLVRKPKTMEKLRSIILDAFGPYSLNASSVTFEGLKSCMYLQYVLNETLRLHSVVPFNSRCAARDTTLPVGGGPDEKSPVFIPKGTEVNFSTHVLHRRHDLWGSDADEFVPERWERRGPRWNYAPFNAGPRICIGQQYALTEAGYVIVRILQKYDEIEGLEIDPTRDWHNFNLTCSPGPGSNSVKVRMHIADAGKVRWSKGC